MDLHVDLVPPHSPPYVGAGASRAVVLVVDPLRSATNAAILLARGARDVFVTDGLRAARQVSAREGAVAIGERDGVPPEGFNLGNSPRALLRAEVGASVAVLLAADSPRALAFGAALGPTALVGLTNALAAAQRVCALEPDMVHLVCAGRDGAPDLADVVAAGLLVSHIARLAASGAAGSDVVLSGAAGFCLSTLRLAEEPLDALWVSESGAALRAAGLEDDLAIVSGVGTTDTLAWVQGVEEVAGRPVVKLGSVAPV
jgi:2-phosphosulfolactate phosphatase